MCSHIAGDALGGVKLNHNPFSAIKQPSLDPTVERETDLAQLPSQPQAASGPATELTQDPDVDMLDTENQPDRQCPSLFSVPAQEKERHAPVYPGGIRTCHTDSKPWDERQRSDSLTLLSQQCCACLQPVALPGV